MQQEYRPFECVRIDSQEASAVEVSDSLGRIYVSEAIEERACSFRLAATPGTHIARLMADGGAVVEAIRLRVVCETSVNDSAGTFMQLLANLKMTMLNCCAADGDSRIRLNGKDYAYFICWLRDHTHTMKGMKYFHPELKLGSELYADTQREDGMVYDRVKQRESDAQGWRDYSFREGDFVKTMYAGGTEGTPYTVQRIPVENDVEFLFLECLYYTWKATRDTQWMSRYLDHAIAAVRYATGDPYRWSEQYGLLKRGYTIDTWDFMHDDDCALTLGDNVCDLEKTTFGVMHGDNTGMAASARYLAEMLRAAGRDEEAPAFQQLADELLQRLADVAWDGRGYYRHHVTEDPSFIRDVGGTDEAAQVSLSNSYALNRGVGAGTCAAILKTYQRIREQMPAASPGEFYNCYPPFEKGFGKQDVAWQYMNGGVSTICAGELAHGAFEHGFEGYGGDILQRVVSLADRHDGHLHVCFNGNPQTEPPDRNFECTDLVAALDSPGACGLVTPEWQAAGGWGDPGNDLSCLPRGRQEFVGVPFEIGAYGLGVASARNGYTKEATVRVGGKHASMYLLHTTDAGHPLVAELEVRYADGEARTVYLMMGEQLGRWFMPNTGEVGGQGHAPKLYKGWPEYQLAWRGGNDTFENVGLFAWGWDNPRPDEEIAELVFKAPAHGGAYFCPAISFSDRGVWFPQGDVSFGIPDAWGAAAVVYAIQEGLAGIVDEGLAFDRVSISPRWQTVGETRASACAHYPASDGCAAYEWEAGESGQRLSVSGTGDEVRVRFLLPEGREVGALTVDGDRVEWAAESVGDSRYACATVATPWMAEVELEYA